MIPHFLGKIILGGDKMTCKELLYVEDALGHEKFMENCSKQTATQLSDQTLATYLKELEQLHKSLYNKFLKLL